MQKRKIFFVDGSVFNIYNYIRLSAEVVFLKRLLSVLISLCLLFSMCVFSDALESQDKRTPAPVILFSEADTDSGELHISIEHRLSDAEALRELVYGIALEEYGSPERLLNSPEKYLAAQTRLYLELSKDKSSWHTVREITDTRFTLSLTDIADFISDSHSAVFMRVLLASENFREENIQRVYIYAPSEEILLCASDNTVFPCGVPVRLSSPAENDIPLPVPERHGYIFDGWSASDEKRISSIPAEAEEITLTAHFIPRSYEINYVLTTNITYPFGRADNSSNPVSYTVGTGTRLYSIKSPVAGFTFGGWYSSADLSGESITEIDSHQTGDKLLYAKWISDEQLEHEKYLQRMQYISDNHLGDPDGDGKITAADARYVLRAAVGLEENNYETLKRADYFGTNRISAENARITLRVAVGLDDLYAILLENGLLP